MCEPNRSVRNHWMAATNRWASARLSNPSAGRMSVPEQKCKKGQNKKESRRYDALGTPLEATRDPLWILLYTWAEKKLQSADTVLRMVKTGDQWLCVPRWICCPAEMDACELFKPQLGIA